MTATLSLIDPGALLGKTVLKIGQVFLLILLIGCGYMSYLASEHFFSGWDSEFDADLARIFPGQSPDSILFYFFIALGVKILVWLGFLFWLNRKI